MSTFSIGQVARETGLGVETIRFYERQGLIEKPPRRPSGYRQYGRGDVARLAFIQHAKTLGFSLREIGELLSLKVDPDATCHEVREQAQAKLQDINDKIRKLKRMQHALKKLVDDCPGKGPLADCPILEALDIRR